MTENAIIKKFSLDEIETARARGESETRADAPEAEPLGEEFWAHAVRVRPRERKASVHLRVDADVLDWFKAQGPGHLTRMNAVLRAYFEAMRGGARPSE
ncbi:MAG: BrnA antitoxin family protein [Sphingopyxis terrae]|nr:MAG: BrnA antitoxin family protein [Sphingopyxis terrae]PWB83827.1 MAG: hypothetical protein C3F11_04570 [Methylocystaceae bacterium]